MVVIKRHGKLNATCYDYMISGGGRPIPYRSTTDVLEYICNTLHFIYICLEYFEKTRFGVVMCTKKRSKCFKKNNLTIPEHKTRNFKEKRQYLLTDIGGK